MQRKNLCEAGKWRLGIVKPGNGVSGHRARDIGKATGSVQKTGLFRELLDLGGGLGAGRCL